MSEPKFTPGEWAIESARVGDEVKNPQYAVRIYSRDPGPENASTIGFAYDPDGPTRRAHAKLWAAAKDLYGALREIQWGNAAVDPDSGQLSPTVYNLCPLCDQSEVRGHAPDCLVGNALGKALGEA
jgi:hypothetical protein